MTKNDQAVSAEILPVAEGCLYLLSALIEKDDQLKTIENHLKDKVKIIKTENLGRKALAHPIKKHNELILTSIFFTAEPAVISEVEKDLRHEDDVVRFLLTTWKGDVTKEDGPARRTRRAPVREKVTV